MIYEKKKNVQVIGRKIVLSSHCDYDRRNEQAKQTWNDEMPWLLL